ncbi:MAG: hypothetical protein ACKVP7_23410 [Hyphomicrobiaceae bacterium]
MQRLCGVAVVILIGAMFAGAAGAQDSGLVGLHDKVRVGNKICMADHFHTGTSSGRNSRKEAEAAAMSDWAGFTAWEYGNAWGQPGMAESKGMSCANSGGWGCTFEARPCRRR